MPGRLSIVTAAGMPRGAAPPTSTGPWRAARNRRILSGIREATGPDPTPPPGNEDVAKPTKKLEDILVEAGIATTKDLERARRRMSERGGRLLGNIASLDGFDDVAFARGLAK